MLFEETCSIDKSGETPKDPCKQVDSIPLVLGFGLSVFQYTPTNVFSKGLQELGLLEEINRPCVGWCQQLRKAPRNVENPQKFAEALLLEDHLEERNL